MPTTTPRRLIRDRYIRGAIVAAQRGDTNQSLASFLAALRYVRAMNATLRDSYPKPVT